MMSTNQLPTSHPQFSMNIINDQLMLLLSLLVINATCLSIVPRATFDNIDADATVVMIDEPEEMTWRLYRRAEAMNVRTNVVVMIECSTQRIAIAFLDMPIGLDCAIAHIDAMRKESFTESVRHVIEHANEWRREKTCKLPPEILMAIAFYTCVAIIAYLCDQCRRVLVAKTK